MNDVQISREEFVREWINDLRSGEYKQHKGSLHNLTNDAHCCLGIAELTARRLNLPINAKHQWLPDTWFVEIMGSNNPICNNGCTCSNMNDRLQMSFSEIADELERTFLSESGSN